MILAFFHSLGCNFWLEVVKLINKFTQICLGYEFYTNIKHIHASWEGKFNPSIRLFRICIQRRAFFWITKFGHIWANTNIFNHLALSTHPQKDQKYEYIIDK